MAMTFNTPMTPNMGAALETTTAMTAAAAARPPKRRGRPPLDGSTYATRITACYPLEDHEENPLLAESVTAFCFPSGKIPLLHAANEDDEEERKTGLDAPRTGCRKFITL